MYYAELNVPKNHVYIFKPQFYHLSVRLYVGTTTNAKNVLYYPHAENLGVDTGL